MSLSLERQALFSIPFWSCEFKDVSAFHAEMVEDVESLLDKSDETKVHLADQTMEDPFRLNSKGWRVLEVRCQEVFQELVEENFQRWYSGEFHWRRWAVRLGRQSSLEKSRLLRESVHNHYPAFLSSIYYLSVPDELSENDEGGTQFRNPFAFVSEKIFPRTTVVQAKQGRLVVFPSFVDHTAVPVEWAALQQSRIAVVSDLFYVSGYGDYEAEGKSDIIRVGRQKGRE